MLLSDNTNKVIDLLNMYDNLNDVDKIQLSIYLLENKNFSCSFNINELIILLKEILNNLDINYNKTIVNFNKYKHLVFLSSKYLELNNDEKKRFIIEMLFNIYETDFKKKTINEKINQELNIYDFYYSLLNY